MEVLDHPGAAAKWCSTQRENGKSIGFVPTMGALHEGHLSLIRRSVEENDVTCASIFVNPLQFNDPHDYANYPTQTQSDHEKLRRSRCDMAFGGTRETIFPEVAGGGEVEILDPGPYAIGLEGEHRPGHFGGVCTVVARLFGFVGQCRAYFGEKDYQQLLIIQALAKRLGYPDIAACPTVRNADGVALSSRNRLLTRQELKIASALYRSLNAARACWDDGERQAERLRQAMRAELNHPDIQLEYAEIKNPNHWLAELTGPASTLRDEAAIALVAARVGSAQVRLIDNDWLHLPQS